MYHVRPRKKSPLSGLRTRRLRPARRHFKVFSSIKRCPRPRRALFNSDREMCYTDRCFQLGLPLLNNTIHFLAILFVYTTSLIYLLITLLLLTLDTLMLLNFNTKGRGQMQRITLFLTVFPGCGMLCLRKSKMPLFLALARLLNYSEIICWCQFQW